jgi:hypothetical protein
MSVQERMGTRFVEPPPECLWWADDPHPVPVPSSAVFVDLADFSSRGSEASTQSAVTIICRHLNFSSRGQTVSAGHL